jgi:hypothetical protein
MHGEVHAGEALHALLADQLQHRFNNTAILITHIHRHALKLGGADRSALVRAQGAVDGTELIS